MKAVGKGLGKRVAKSHRTEAKPSLTMSKIPTSTAYPSAKHAFPQRVEGRDVQLGSCGYERPISQIAHVMLDYLRSQLGIRTLNYRTLPRAITDGWETYAFRFQLTGNNLPDGWEHPLILRQHVGCQGLPRLRHEVSVHRHLMGLGYPVPEVIWHEEDCQILGGPFLFMNEIAGANLLQSLLCKPWNIFTATAEMAKVHASLHALSSIGFPKPAERYLGIHPGGTEAIIRHYNLKGLERGFRWLQDYQPSSITTPSILHLDFHPLNLLVPRNGGTLTVIDWTYAEIGDPHADVATTLMLLECVPVLGQQFLERCATRIGRHFLRRSYLAEYSSLRAIDEERLAYYRAWAALRRLAQYGRWLSAGPACSGCKTSLLARLDLGHLIKLEEYFTKWTGVEVHL